MAYKQKGTNQFTLIHTFLFLHFYSNIFYSQIVDKYVKDARTLISSQQQTDIETALNLLDAALSLSPKCEQALELKARSLLYLRKYKQVADMLQDYIPSLKMSSDDSSTTSSSSSSVSSDGNSQPLSRERVKLLSSGGHSPERGEPVIKCFSVSDLKKKVTASLGRNCDKEGQWRYIHRFYFHFFLERQVLRHSLFVPRY